jgi:hypothetical protein
MLLLDASAAHPLDGTTIDRLADRLATTSSPLTVIEPFRSFLEWIRRDVVEVPEEVVVRLFTSALDNPTIRPKNRALLFSQLSSYFHIVGNVQEAVTTAIAAIEEDPSEPAHHISLANLAMLHSNFELAAAEIDAANRMDSLGRWALETRKLSETLASVREAAEASPPDELALR